MKYTYRTGWSIVATQTSRFIDLAQDIAANLQARYQPILDSLTPQQQRAAAGSAVALLHVLVVVALLLGLRVSVPVSAPEFEMTLGGPIGERAAPTPRMFVPKLQTVQQPQPAPPQPDDTYQANVAQPSGSSNVTMPAEAIASEHAFPPMPLGLNAQKPMIVRLAVSITEEGAISDASVQASSGDTTLDDLAIAWVKAHWRYLPARQDGNAIAVVTTAVVGFAPA